MSGVETEFMTFLAENARAQLLHDIGLAVLVKSHQFVHTEDRQTDEQAHLPIGLSDLPRIQFINIIVRSQQLFAELIPRTISINKV